MQFSKTTLLLIGLSGAVAGQNICTVRQAVRRGINHLQFSFCVSSCHAFIQNDTQKSWRHEPRTFYLLDGDKDETNLQTNLNNRDYHMVSIHVLRAHQLLCCAYYVYSLGHIQWPEVVLCSVTSHSDVLMCSSLVYVLHMHLVGIAPQYCVFT